MKPAREAANGKFGLRYTRGGFGTPFFGDDRQLRVEGDELVSVEGGKETRTKLDVVYPGASAALGDWYGFAASVLEELRADAGPDLEPSRVQLWPEHFDMAVELGAEAAADAPATAARPATRTIPSRTSMSRHGRRRRPAIYGTRPRSAARSSPTLSCWRATTNVGWRSSSSEKGATRSARSVLTGLAALAHPDDRLDDGGRAVVVGQPQRHRIVARRREAARDLRGRPVVERAV